MKDTTPVKLIQPKPINAKTCWVPSVPLHWHDFYEIELIVSGNGTHKINGAEYEWKPRNMHFLRLTDFHEITVQGNSLLHLVQISPNTMPEELLRTLNRTEGTLVTSLSQKDFAYANMLCTMIEDQATHHPEDKKMIEHLLNVLIRLFFRSFQTTETPSGDLDKELLSNIIMYISENFRENLTLDILARKFFISKNYLCFYFKKHMGTTVINYLKEKRLDYAAKLATSTNIKSIEICEACGYGSVSNFLRDFKQKFGVSPLEMRKRR